MPSPRVRLTAAAALVAAAVVALVLVLAGGAGGSSGESSDFAWGKDTKLIPTERKGDHILYGSLRNDSLQEINLDVAGVKLYDEDDKVVQSSVRFLAAFAHGIYPWSQRPKPLGDFERRRLGEIARIQPDRTVPITLSWRVPEGAKPPVRVDFGPDDLRLPGAP